MTTVESNILIAQFMGKDHLLWNGEEMIPISEWRNQKTLSFHYSWNWLMPVVEKIESLTPRFVVFIQENECSIENLDKSFGSYARPTKMEAVYNAVVEFIKWHNQNKK